MKYESKAKIKKQKKKEQEEIILTLPNFVNELLLLINSGLVLGEAFSKIAMGYQKLDSHNQNFFTRKVVEICESSDKKGTNVISEFYMFARTTNVKELTRIANLLTENMDKGTELWTKIADLGEQVWNERKRLGMENIRLAESKMSFPLGIMLIALIIITSAPAMMQIR